MVNQTPGPILLLQEVVVPFRNYLERKQAPKFKELCARCEKVVEVFKQNFNEQNILQRTETGIGIVKDLYKQIEKLDLPNEDKIRLANILSPVLNFEFQEYEEQIDLKKLHPFYRAIYIYSLNSATAEEKAASYKFIEEGLREGSINPNGLYSADKTCFEGLFTPFLFACVAQCPEIVQLMLDRKINPNVIKLNLKSQNSTNETALHIACKNGDIRTVKILCSEAEKQKLDKAKFLDASTSTNWTPLMFAIFVPKISESHVDCIRYLLSKGANVDQLVTGQSTLILNFTIATAMNYPENENKILQIISLLLDHNAKLFTNQKNGAARSTIMICCLGDLSNYLDFVLQKSLAKRQSLKELYKSSSSVFMKAFTECMVGKHLKCAKVLLRYFETELLNSYKIIEKATATINNKDDLKVITTLFKNTILGAVNNDIFVEYSGFFNKINFDYNYIDEEGNPILHHFVASDSIDSLQYILKNKKIDLNAQDADGNTALHLCVLQGGKEQAQLLLNAGADISLKNKRGDSARSLAEKSQDNEIRALFKLAPLFVKEDVTKEEILHEDLTVIIPTGKEEEACATEDTHIPQGKLENEAVVPVAIATPEPKKKKNAKQTAKKQHIVEVKQQEKPKATFEQVSYPNGQTKQQFLRSIKDDVSDSKLYSIIEKNLNDFIECGGRTYVATNTSLTNVREFRLTYKHRLYVRTKPDNRELEVCGFSGKTRQKNYISTL